MLTINADTKDENSKSTKPGGDTGLSHGWDKGAGEDIAQFPVMENETKPCQTKQDHHQLKKLL